MSSDLLDGGGTLALHSLSPFERDEVRRKVARLFGLDVDCPLMLGDTQESHSRRDQGDPFEATLTLSKAEQEDILLSILNDDEDSSTSMAFALTNASSAIQATGFDLDRSLSETMGRLGPADCDAPDSPPEAVAQTLPPNVIVLHATGSARIPTRKARSADATTTFTIRADDAHQASIQRFVERTADTGDSSARMALVALRRYKDVEARVCMRYTQHDTSVCAVSLLVQLDSSKGWSAALPIVASPSLHHDIRALAVELSAKSYACAMRASPIYALLRESPIERHALFAMGGRPVRYHSKAPPHILEMLDECSLSPREITFMSLRRPPGVAGAIQRKLLQHRERMAADVDALLVACDAAFQQVEIGGALHDERASLSWPKAVIACIKMYLKLDWKRVEHIQTPRLGTGLNDGAEILFAETKPDLAEPRLRPVTDAQVRSLA